MKTKIFLISKKVLIIYLTIILLFITSVATYAAVVSATPPTFEDLYREFQLQKNENTLSQEDIEKVQQIYKSNKKVAYLTFDDGPTKRCTPFILDILKENNIHATFFVTGERVDKNPAIIKRAYEEGNYIANHTYSHKNNKIYESKESFLYEILRTDKAISNAIGVTNYHSHIFRFPNGSTASKKYSIKKKCISYLNELNYTYLDWNCLNQDGIKKVSTSKLLENLKNSSKNKNSLVILMHDSGDVNKTNLVLQDSISYLKEQGYEFRTLYDLLEQK